MFVGVVDAQLLEAILRTKVFESEYIQHTNRVSGVQNLVLVQQRVVDLRYEPNKWL